MFSRYKLAGFAGLSLAGALLTQPALAQNQPGLPAANQAIGLASDSLSLGGTVQAVLDANPGIANLTELANAAGSRLSQTQAGYLPQITGSAVYTRLDPVSKVAFGNETLSFVPNNNFDAHITAQYELYDFGKRTASTNLARSQVQTAQDNIIVARRDLAFNAAQTYYNILFMRESIRVQDQQIASLVAHRNDMQKRVDAGVSTKFDVTTTDVRITQAQNTKLDLQNQLRNQQVQLARLLHKPQQADI
ncbi:MAG: TolC family protein, partial [Hymenobacter sp.]